MNKTVKGDRQALKEGDTFRIDLGDGTHAYGRALRVPLFAFYEYVGKQEFPIDSILAMPTAFRIWVMKYAVTSGRWKKIGNSQLNIDILSEVSFFKKDPLTKKYSIYREGCELSATARDVKDLDYAAVWDPEHVEERLRDYAANRPNRSVEAMKP